MGDLDEKIANFNPENNNSERRMRTKGSLPSWYWWKIIAKFRFLLIFFYYYNVGKGAAKHNYEHGTCIKVHHM